MIFTDTMIKKAIEEGLLSFNNSVAKEKIWEQINANSLDVTISSMYKRPVINTNAITYGKFFEEKSYWRSYNEKTIELRPGEFILACTNEYFHFPKNVCGTISIKSSLGRLFVNITGDTNIDAGFSGALTLAIRNEGLHTIRIPENSRIAQVRFYGLDNVPEKAYGERESRYMNSAEAECMQPEDLGRSQNETIQEQSYIKVRSKLVETQTKMDRKIWVKEIKKPCPKCGQIKTVNYSRFDEPCEDDMVKMCYEISCSGCGFGFHRKFPKLWEALKDWNDSCPDDK